MATRAGSRLDSTITILDEHGAELDFVDDYYIHKDPYLSFPFVPAMGTVNSPGLNTPVV